jgi:hypothetical protein
MGPRVNNEREEKPIENNLIKQKTESGIERIEIWRL